MNKTFEQIQREIEREFIGGNYDGITATEEILTEIIGKNISWYDTRIDDGVDEDETEDTYVMVSCFSTNDSEYTIRLYYGNVTEEVTYVSVEYKDTPKNNKKNFVYLLVDEYICDAERMETMINVFSIKDSAIKALKERFEWYKKETYISQFIKEDGSIDEDAIGDYDWDVDDDSVDIHIYENDTHLSLYIKQEEIKNV